jgi:ribosomal protein S14
VQFAEFVTPQVSFAAVFSPSTLPAERGMAIASALLGLAALAGVAGAALPEPAASYRGWNRCVDCALPARPSGFARALVTRPILSRSHLCSAAAPH